MITIDPGVVGCDEYLDHDYFLDDPRTTTPALDPHDYLDYIDNRTTTSPTSSTSPTLRHRLLPPRPEDLLLSVVKPEALPSFHTCAPKPYPQPYILMPFCL